MVVVVVFPAHRGRKRRGAVLPGSSLQPDTGGGGKTDSGVEGTLDTARLYEGVITWSLAKSASPSARFLSTREVSRLEEEEEEDLDALAPLLTFGPQYILLTRRRRRTMQQRATQTHLAAGPIYRGWAMVE